MRRAPRREDRREAGRRSRGVGVRLTARQLARLHQRLIVIKHVLIVGRFEIIGSAELFQPAARAAVGEADGPRTETALVAAIAERYMRRDANEIGCLARFELGASVGVSSAILRGFAIAVGTRGVGLV